MFRRALYLLDTVAVGGVIICIQLLSSAFSCCQQFTFLSPETWAPSYLVEKTFSLQIPWYNFFFRTFTLVAIFQTLLRYIGLNKYRGKMNCKGHHPITTSVYLYTHTVHYSTTSRHQPTLQQYELTYPVCMCIELGPWAPMNVVASLGDTLMSKDRQDVSLLVGERLLYKLYLK